MRKVILGLAAGVVGLVLAGTADANPGHFRPEFHREAAHERGHVVRFQRDHRFERREHDHGPRPVWHARFHR
jgi:hypothetical protein